MPTNKKTAVAKEVATSKPAGDSKAPSDALVDRLAKEKNPLTKTTLNKKMNKAEKNREKIIKETQKKAKEEVTHAKEVAKKVEKSRKKGKSDPTENNIPKKELLERTGMPAKKEIQS